mgnify:CR=1 FL=1
MLDAKLKAASANIFLFISFVLNIRKYRVISKFKNVLLYKVALLIAIFHIYYISTNFF